ncbi:hypothetical protein [Cyclobacterium sp.]|nr:hypothetical protein [Cyclobacterium sp.]
MRDSPPTDKTLGRGQVITALKRLLADKKDEIVMGWLSAIHL